MFKWLKSQKKVTVQAICELPHAAQHFPIRRASGMMPQWWRHLPDYSEISPTDSNMKKCRGLLDLYGSSFVIPLWTDICIEVSDKGSILNYDSRNSPSQEENKADITIVSADRLTRFNQHQVVQSTGLYDPNEWIHVKIISPWIIESDIKFTWFEPTYGISNFLSSIRILPGILDFSQQVSTHINMLVKRQPGQLILPANMPLAHLIPLTDRPIEIKCINDPERVRNRRAIDQPWAFRDSVSKRERIKKDLKSPGGCPFG